MAVIVEGLDELQRNFKGFVLDVDKAINEAVRATTLKVQRNAIVEIVTPSIGESVTRYTPSGNPYPHIASKPGDAPNTDTGRLIGSIDTLMDTQSQTGFVFTNLEYGFFLETILNRPFLEPAKQKAIPDFKKLITKALEKQIEQI